MPNRPRAPRAQPEPALARGRFTRRRILDATASLCIERGGGQLSIAEVAAAAGVYPNQITYYFGSKDSLLVHAAFYALLQDAQSLEAIAETAVDAEEYRVRLARAASALPSLRPVARALALRLANADIAGIVSLHIRLLVRQSTRHVRTTLQQRGWVLQRSIAGEVATFWSLVIGAALLADAGLDADVAGALSIGEPDGTQRQERSRDRS